MREGHTDSTYLLRCSPLATTREGFDRSAASMREDCLRYGRWLGTGKDGEILPVEQYIRFTCLCCFSLLFGRIVEEWFL